MAFCPNCGAQATGTFCPNCGTAIAGGSAGSAGGTDTRPLRPPPSSSGLTNNVASMLCYFPFFIGLICSIVFLVVAPYNQNKTVRFNAFQSLFLHFGLFVFWIVLAHDRRHVCACHARVRIPARGALSDTLALYFRVVHCSDV